MIFVWFLLRKKKAILNFIRSYVSTINHPET